MRKILILRGGALGDFIVTLPALLGLRQHWPEAEITLVGNTVAAQLARTRGVIDHVISQHEARWLELYRPVAPQDNAGLSDALRNFLHAFDLVVSYWPDPEGTLARHFPSRSGQRFVTAPALPTQAPASTHYAAPLRELGVAIEGHHCRILTNRIVWGNPLLPSTSAPPKTRDFAPGSSTQIAIHPGSGSPRKNWPAARWREFIATLATPVLLVLGEAERKEWTQSQTAPLADNVRVLLHTPLDQLVEELSSCRLFLGHDSGVSHLAAACGAPCVLLFGPTDPQVWAPPAPQITVLRRGEALASLPVAEVRSAMTRALGGANADEIHGQVSAQMHAQGCKTG